MLYLTQILYVKKGQEQTFHAFEDHVLPLLQRHNGELLYRVRPTNEQVIETAIGYPYEVHLVTFRSKSDFDNYRDDPDRQAYTALRNVSIERSMLVEGQLI